VFAERWMIVYDDMQFDDVNFKIESGGIEIEILKKGMMLKGKIEKQNEFTKVYQIATDDFGTIYLVDMQSIDKHFEENTIIFKNRRGLHREIKRYIDFSLN
jgi:hypothetical protein